LGSALFRAAVADVWQRRLTPIAAVAADELLLLALAARSAVLHASCSEVMPTAALREAVAAAVSMRQEEALCRKGRRSIKGRKRGKGSLLEVVVRLQATISQERLTRINNMHHQRSMAMTDDALSSFVTTGRKNQHRSSRCLRMIRG
jgi:hypothetical protein